MALAVVFPSAVSGDSAVDPPVLCYGQEATEVGSPRADRLRATKGRDVIVGLGGGDRVRRMSGFDLFCGGGGDDSVIKRVTIDQHAPLYPDDPGFGAGFVIGGSGDDSITLNCAGSTAPSDVAWAAVWGGPGNDLIDSNCPYADTTIGGPGNDTIRFGAGPDHAYGEDGDDLLIDAYSTPADCDPNLPEQLSGSWWRYCRDVGIIWLRFDDELDGGIGNDVLIGGEASDMLVGADGDDALSGGAGQDVVSGGPGFDHCDGGPGDYDFQEDQNGLFRGDCESAGNFETDPNVIYGGPPPGGTSPPAWP